MNRLRIVSNPDDSGMEWPISVSINGAWFAAKEKLVVDPDTGHVWADGKFEGFIKGDFVLSVEYGIMSPV